MAVSQNKWMMDFFDQSIESDSLFWCAFNGEAEVSTDNSSSNQNDVNSDGKSHAKKRKASREKLRRDRLNERFIELSAVLDPRKPPKVDKICILADAFHIVNQMKAEAKKLRSSNETLRETIRTLRVEKNELREEKVKLKIEKETLEKKLKTMDLTSGYLPHPAFRSVIPTQLMTNGQFWTTNGKQGLASQTQLMTNKWTTVYEDSGTGMGMWRWMPLSNFDSSQDHMPFPPVA